MERADLERLQEQLLDKDQDRRAIAIIELEQRWREIGSTEAISLLEATLYDDTTSQDNRQLIIGGLAHIGIETQEEAEVILILAEAMNQATESRLDALAALARIGKEAQAQAEVIPILIQAAESEDEELSFHAIDALDIMQHPYAMEFLAGQAQTELRAVLLGPLTFGERVVLSEGSIGHGNPRMALSGRNVYVTWPAGEPDAEVYFTRSRDSGASFAWPVNLGRGPARRCDPVIAASGNSVYVVWRGWQGDIFFARSNSNGASFLQDVNLSNSPGLSSVEPQIAAAGSFVYVVWTEGHADFGDGSQDILFRASADNGATFGEIVNLSEAVEHQVVDGVPVYCPAASSDPAVAAVGRNVYVVWANPVGEGRVLADGTVVEPDDTVVCRTSGDGGASFDAPIILSRGYGVWGRPLIAAEGDNVYVVWRDTPEVIEDMLFRASRDRGVTFDDAVNLRSAMENTEHGDLRLAASGNNVYVVWSEPEFADLDIFFRASSNRGESFEPLVYLSRNHFERSVAPSISASGNHVYVAWEQARPQQHGSVILLRSSTDSAQSFSDAYAISEGFHSRAPSVIGDGSKVYTVWSEDARGAIFRKGSRYEFGSPYA